MAVRVLHFIKTSVGARWALNQMRELTKLGVEVHVALPPGGPLISCYEASGIVVHRLQPDFPIRAVWRCPGVLRSLRDLVGCVKPDMLHSHFVGTTLALRLALGKAHPTPRIFQVPGPLHLEHTFFRRAELLTAGSSDWWVGSCRWTCDRYRRSGIPEDRIFLSYYGSQLADLDHHAPGKLRAELQVDPGTKLVGMVAFMYAPKRFLGQERGIKGHEDLIDAMALCLESEPNILCVFMGGAWGNASDYERRVRSYGLRRLGNQARFLGTRSDVAELYSDLDVVVHPSHSENVGGAAESLLLAVPTIATAVGGLPDVVEPGVTGWLVPPHDPGRLAIAILDALNDPRRSRAMAARGRARVAELLDVRRTAAEIFGIYQAILSRPRRHG